MYKGYITDVEGIHVGHSTDLEAMTGCTVIIYEDKNGAVGGIDVRGSAPGTRETDLFDPKKLVDRVNAIVLTGGSAFGLDSASGVMKYLEEEGLGLDVDVARVPIVPAAAIFDLTIGDANTRPDFDMGYAAARNSRITENRQGNIGCGTGAMVGKIKGKEYNMKSGLGSATIKVGDLVVSALIVVNALGDIFNYKTGEQIAGPFDRVNKNLLNGYNIMKESNNKIGFERNYENTTIGVIATNAKLNKSQANKVAEMGHNGMAKSINPVHTMSDGDTLFTMATGKVESDVNLIGTIAAEVVSRAIENAIYNAESFRVIPAYKDMKQFIRVEEDKKE